MRNLISIFSLLLITPCANCKNVPGNVIHNANVEKYQQAMQRSKDAFLITDSVDIICNDLGWAKRLVDGSKIGESPIPLICKNEGDSLYDVVLPCQEFDTPEFWVSTVIVEHKQLESALVKAKMQGVDDIFSRSGSYIKSHCNQQGEYIVDSVEYSNDYADYVRNAHFSCICIKKDKRKYIVNATIRIPNPNYIREEEKLTLPFNEKEFKLQLEAKFKKYLQQKDSIQAENAETPLEQK